MQNSAQIADERHVHLHVLVDFRGIDFNVNFLGVRRVSLQIAGHAVVKAHAERQQQVGFLNRLVHPGFAVHAHHAEVQQVRSGKRSKTQQRHRDGNGGAFGERLHFVLGAGNQNAVAGQDHRPLGFANQFHRLFVCFLRGRKIGTIAAHLRRGRFPVEFAGGLLRVLGDVDQHRTGASGFRDVKSFANRGRQILARVTR